MAKKTRHQEIHYQVCSIQELEVYIPMLPEELRAVFDKEKLDYGFMFDYAWDLEKDWFSVVVEVAYVYDKTGLNAELLKYLAEMKYLIPQLERFVDAKQKEIKLPEQLLAILTGIAISTIRGMIATRTMGKFQADFHIPILSPIGIVQEYLKLSKV